MIKKTRTDKGLLTILNSIKMAKGKNQYVVPTQGGWGVRSEKSDRLTVKTETKAEAVKIATNSHNHLFRKNPG